VFERIKNNAHVYSPIGIPSHYEVVRNTLVNGNALFEVLPPAQNPYETERDAAARSNAQESQVWSIVPARALFYFLTVFATLALVVFPISGRPDPSAELSSHLRWLSDLIRLSGTVLPGFASRWINGYAERPELFLLCVVAIGAFAWFSGYLGSKISDTMSFLWRKAFDHTLRDPGQLASARQRMRKKTLNVADAWSFGIAPALSAIFLLYFGGAIASHAVYNVFDDAGFVCSESDKTIDVPKEGLRFDFRVSDLCRAPGLIVDHAKRYFISFNQSPDELPAGYQSLPSRCLPNESSQLRSRGVEATLAGFSTFNNDQKHQLTWAEMVLHVFLTPLRRELDRPWFETVMRYGSIGGEESFIDPDPNKDETSLSVVFRPTVSSELFAFLNDAVIGIPGLFGTFYKYNQGCVSVFIKPR
jgi:hypothetical protein